MSGTPSKRAGDLRPGDFIIDPDGVTEVRHVEPYGRVPGHLSVMVTGGYVIRYESLDEQVTLATDAEVKEALAQRARNHAVEDLRALADWLEAAPPTVPAPSSIQVHLDTPRMDSNAARRAWVKGFADLVGVEASESHGSVRAAYPFRDYSTDGPAIEVVAYAGLRKDEPDYSVNSAPTVVGYVDHAPREVEDGDPDAPKIDHAGYQPGAAPGRTVKA